MLNADQNGRAFAENRRPYQIFLLFARTAQVYRKAIDDAAAGKPSIPACWKRWKVWRIVAIPKVPASSYPRRLSELRIRLFGFCRQQFVGEFTGERKGELAAVG